MRYRVVSVGAPGDAADARDEFVEHLAYALAIFGAESTLRHVAGCGSVTLYDGTSRVLLVYDRECLTVPGLAEASG